MTDRHLHEVTTSDTNAESARADLVAAELLGTFGVPDRYERLHSLVSLAYLRGVQDTLQYAGRKLEAALDAPPSGPGWSVKA